MADIWRLDIWNRNGGSAQVTNVPFESAMLNWTLNGPGATEINFPLAGPKAPAWALIAPGKKELKWYRNGNLVWGGVLWGVDTDVTNYTLRVFGEGYFSWLRHRVAENDLFYTDVSAHQVAWNLINYTQGLTNGNLGITQGSHTGGSTAVDRDYCAANFPNLGDAIQDLASMEDTWDFYISPQKSVHTDKVFRTFNPRLGTDLTGTVAITPDNTHALTYQVDAHWVANVVAVTGSDDCLPPAIVEAHAGSQSDYGLLYYIEDTPQFDHYRDILHYAKERKRLHQKPRWTVNATYDDTQGVPFASFDVGDIVQVTVDRGHANFSQGMRCIAYQVDLSLGGGLNPEVMFYTATLDSVTETV